MHNTHKRKITWQPVPNEDLHGISYGDEQIADEQIIMNGPTASSLRRRMEDIVDPRTSTVGRNIVLARSHIGHIEHIAIEEIGADE
jgi:hypothetical protein